MSFGVNKKDMSMKLKAQNLQKTRRQTDELETETRKMHDRLEELKMAMSREKEEREGGFWRSGQKGTLGKYANDILAKPGKSDKSKKKAVRIMKDEPIVLPNRPKGPGTFANLAQRNTGNKENENSKKASCGQCEQKNAHVTCLECVEDYCARCFATFHLKGALKKHRSVPLGANSARTPRGAPPSITTTISSNGNSDGHSDHRPVATPTDIALTLAQSRQSSARSTARSSLTLNGSYNHQPEQDEEDSFGGQGDSLLDGTYDEGQAAADFQEAIRQWRQGNKPAVSPVRSPTVQVEEGIGTDDLVSRSPVEIHFESTLSYAERLLVRQHRRTDVNSFNSNSGTPRSDNIVQSSRGSARPLSSRGNDIMDEELIGERVHFEALAEAMSPSEEHYSSHPPDRPESSVSIVPIDDSMLVSQSTEQTAVYEVTEVPSYEVVTPPVPSSFVEKHRDMEETAGSISIVDVTPAESKRPASKKQSTNKTSKMQHQAGDDLHLDLSDVTESKPSRNLSSKKQPAAITHSKRTQRSAKSQRPISAKGTGRAEEQSSRATSRASSRLSNGESHLMAAPSEPLKELASLARQMTMDIVVNTQSRLDHLEDFFGFGVEDENSKMVERTITPTKDKRPQSRTKSARPMSGRPTSRVGTPREVDKYHLSNKVYQMSNRSWRPDASVADVVDDTQVKRIMEDDFYQRCMTPREEEQPSLESWTGLPWTNEDDNQSVPIQTVSSDHFRVMDPHPPSTPPASSRVKRKPMTPHSPVSSRSKKPSARRSSDQQPSARRSSQKLPSARQSSDQQQSTRWSPDQYVDNNSEDYPANDFCRPTSGKIQEQPTRPFSANRRENSMIVVDGDDLSKYDVNSSEVQTEQDQEDQEAIDQLEWELASHSGNVTKDGQLSRMSLLENDIDSLAGDETPQQLHREFTQEDVEKEFDRSANQLRESEFMQDFEEMEEKIHDEEDVKHLKS